MYKVYNLMALVKCGLNLERQHDKAKCKLCLSWGDDDKTINHGYMLQIWNTVR